jgi:hypothetical protein
LKPSFYGLPLEEAKPEIKPSKYFLLVKNQPYLKKGASDFKVPLFKGATALDGFPGLKQVAWIYGIKDFQAQQIRLSKHPLSGRRD